MRWKKIKLLRKMFSELLNENSFKQKGLWRRFKKDILNDK